MTSADRYIVTDDGVRLVVETDGAAALPPLVLSASLGTGARMWSAQIEALASRFRVIRYDTRGHGRSQVAPGPYTLDRLARDVIAILDTLEIERAHFAGVSLGGMVGQWLGTHAPDRIDRLVLANTSAYMPPRSAWDARIEQVTAHGMTAIADAVVERWFTPHFRERNPATVAAYRAMLVATPPAGYVACCAAVRDMDQRDTVAAIRAPTLIIAGALDVATPPAAAAELSRSIRGSRLITLDAAHLSNVEQPEAFNRAVLELLS
jgi:3-oxoadipate enol-lactonase